MKPDYRMQTILQRLIKQQAPSVQIALRNLFWCQSGLPNREASINGTGEVSIVVRKEKNHSRHASFHGLQNCHNMWACPVCAARGLRFQVERLTALIERRRSDGYVGRMITLTIPHRASETARALLDELKRCKLCYNQRVNKQLREKYNIGLGGSVTSTECKHSFLYGWHFHFHVLYFIREGDSSRLDGDVGKYMVETWRQVVSQLTGKDVSERAQRGAGMATAVISKGEVRNGSYLAKELAKDTNDRYSHSRRSRSPFELLASTSERDKQLFIEYALATKGRSRICLSRGLRQLIDEAALKKKSISSDTISTHVVCSWSYEDWSEIQAREFDGAVWQDSHFIRYALLTAAELDGYSGVVDVCNRYDLPYPRRVDRSAPMDVELAEWAPSLFALIPDTAEIYTERGNKIVAFETDKNSNVTDVEVLSSDEYATMQKYGLYGYGEADLREMTQILEGLF